MGNCFTSCLGNCIGNCVGKCLGHKKDSVPLWYCYQQMEHEKSKRYVSDNLEKEFDENKVKIN